MTPEAALVIGLGITAAGIAIGEGLKAIAKAMVADRKAAKEFTP